MSPIQHSITPSTCITTKPAATMVGSQSVAMVTAPRDVAAFFRENGFVTSLPVLDKQESLELRAGFDGFELNTGKDNCQYSLHNVHLTWPWVLKIAAHPKLLGPVRQILGDDVVLLDSRFICKYPISERDQNEAPGYVAWHQDVRYWGVEGDVVSVWLAVDDADDANGCLQVIPGTHTSGIFEHRQAMTGGNMLTSNQEIPTDLFDSSVVISCPLKAGQMSIHHGHLVHGSQPNYSNKRRCGYVIRFVSTSCQPTDDPDRPRKFASTVLVSGVDKHHHFVDNAPLWFHRVQEE